MSDALERLRNRQRPEVPVRDASLVSREADTLISSTQDSIGVDTSTSRYLETKKSRVQESKNLEDLKTKQTTMRLEAHISDHIQDVCRANGLSREVLIEALFLHCQSNGDVWQSVIDVAKKRSHHRQQLANLRRAQSMIHKFEI